MNKIKLILIVYIIVLYVYQVINLLLPVCSYIQIQLKEGHHELEQIHTWEPSEWYQTAFKILVVRASRTTKKVAGQLKILMWLSNGQQ